MGFWNRLLRNYFGVPGTPTWPQKATRRTVEYKIVSYKGLPAWMRHYEENVEDIEALATAKDWDYFKLDEDIIAHGKNTELYIAEL